MKKGFEASLISIHQPLEKITLSELPFIDESSNIANCFASNWTSIGANNKMIESSIGDYTYTMAFLIGGGWTK
jgi:hypothetical protein